MDRPNVSVFSMTWTHTVDPMRTICSRELIRRCRDKNCDEEHFRNAGSETGHALNIVDRLQLFFDEITVQGAEKEIVRTKLDIHKGKNVDEAVSSLVSSLCPPALAAPLYVRSAKPAAGEQNQTPSSEK